MPNDEDARTGLVLGAKPGDNRHGRPKRGTSTPVIINATARRSMVIELRKAGLSYRDIADAVIKHYGADNLPKGYDQRYAHKDVMRVLELTRTEMREDAQTIIEIELERLDALMMALWDRATGGELKAVDRILNIMNRRAKLLGLERTNLYIETDWRKEAAQKGLSPAELFDKVVDAYVKRLESGADDAEFEPVGDGELEVTGGSISGGFEESEAEIEDRGEISGVSGEIQE